jgi:hypothetical protein
MVKVLKFLFLILVFPYFSYGLGDHLYQINSGLILGESADGIFFGLHRVDNDPKALQFWKEFEERERVGNMRRYRHLLDAKGKQDPECPNLRVGSAAQGYASWHVLDGSGEKWIAYVARRWEENPHNLKPYDIEMVVTVLTQAGAPMTSHMGINRCFDYMAERLETGNKISFPIHKDLAPKIHAFGAKCMINLYPEKLYMITYPVFMMAYITKRALPEHVYLQMALPENREYLRDEIVNGTKQGSQWMKLFSEARQLPEGSERISLEERAARTRDTQIAEIQEIILTPTPLPSPIKEDINGATIWDSKRQHVIFKWDNHEDREKMIHVNGQTLRGKEGCAPYQWFTHINREAALGYMAVDLKPLADLLHLKDRF